MDALLTLTWTAIAIGATHTFLGVDHYLPFVVLGRSNNWSYPKLLIITGLCGLGHVLSSVVLGVVGIALGHAVGMYEAIEGTRGDLAAWALMSLGFLYMLYGIRYAIKNKKHTHIHVHADGEEHTHEHDHHGEHGHTHEPAKKSGKNLFWVLFIVFVLGPCEPLIPILMYPAASESAFTIFVVSFFFALTTISVMLLMAFLLYSGLKFVRIEKLEKFTHTFAGFAILVAGALIKFAGL